MFDICIVVRRARTRLIRKMGEVILLRTTILRLWYLECSRRVSEISWHISRVKRCHGASSTSSYRHSALSYVARFWTTANTWSNLTKRRKISRKTQNSEVSLLPRCSAARPTNSTWKRNVWATTTADSSSHIARSALQMMEQLTTLTVS